MRKISIGGILLGGITDIVSTFVLGLPTGLVALSRLDYAHIPQERLHGAIAAALAAPSVFAAQTFAGLIGSFLGGVVAAGVARRNELLNGALSAVLCISLGIVVLITGHNQYPLWLDMLGMVAGPAAGLAGGSAVRSVRLRRRLPVSVSG